jgi:membrane protein DedA with SNARE-associated domain
MSREQRRGLCNYCGHRRGVGEVMSTWIRSIIEQFSYPGIAFLLVIENVFPPIPSELIIPLAGFVSSQGHLAIGGVIVAGTLGSVAGAVLLYYFGRGIGAMRLRRWTEAHGRWIGLSTSDLDKSDRWFKRHGAKTVLIARVVPGVRSLISIPAGIAGVDLGVFLLFTTLGSSIWMTGLALAGRLLGRNYEQVEHVIGPISTLVIGGMILALIVRGIRNRRSSRR